jgi:NADPH:quinone reductase-like Zn-dependent oxidoreductase
MNALAARPLPFATYRAYRMSRGDGLDRLAPVARERRPLALDEVRVRMRAVALNHRDLMVAMGTSGVPGREIVPASDGAGEVIEVGAAVRDRRVGERVFASFFPDWLAGPMTDDVTARALGGSMDGVLAEEVVLPASAWVPVPAPLDFFAAATLPCAGVTAWHALFALDPLPPGATVALLGTGGVSIWALQLAKAAGLRVLITSSDDAKLERAWALGADGTVNYRRTPEWGTALHDLAGGGVERVLDLGGPDTIAQSLRAVRTGGSVAVIGRLTGTAPAAFDPAVLFAGGKRLVGLMVGSRALAADLARFVERSGLHPVIDRVFPFADAAAAYRHLAAGRHLGKVVVAIDGDGA